MIAKVRETVPSGTHVCNCGRVEIPRQARDGKSYIRPGTVGCEKKGANDTTVIFVTCGRGPVTVIRKRSVGIHRCGHKRRWQFCAVALNHITDVCTLIDVNGGGEESFNKGPCYAQNSEKCSPKGGGAYAYTPALRRPTRLSESHFQRDESREAKIPVCAVPCLELCGVSVTMGSPPVIEQSLDNTS